MGLEQSDRHVALLFYKSVIKDNYQFEGYTESLNEIQVKRLYVILPWV